MKGHRNKMILSYWENGKMLCKGTVEEIAKFTRKSANTIYSWNEKGFENLRKEGVLRQIFEVYTKDGDVLFRGTSEECADMMCIERCSFRHIIGDMIKGKRTGANGAELVRKIGVELR